MMRIGVQLTPPHGRRSAGTTGRSKPALCRGAALLLAALWAGGAGVALAQNTSQNSRQSGGTASCQDLGSFAVVDPQPIPRGAIIVAQPHQPCADLPGQRQPDIFIDAQVQVPAREREGDKGAQPPRLPRPRH
jgi:hypothetical protein